MAPAGEEPTDQRAITPLRYRQLRGLALHFREAWPRMRRRRTFHRALIATLPPGGGERGICRWCGLRLADGSMRRWDPGCIATYRIAVGGRVDAHGKPLAPRSNCSCGQPGQEMDHADALILAWTSGDPRRLIRAYTQGNLQWLCHECHAAKTRRDLGELAEMRARQVFLAGMTPGAQGSPRPWWTLADGGVAPRRGRGFQRIHPVTFSPRNVTCPRCLVAMRDPPELPHGWALDERGMELELRAGRRLSVDERVDRERRPRLPAWDEAFQEDEGGEK